MTSIFHGIGIFLLSFSISMALGVAFGLSTSLMLKHSYLHLYPSIESCLVALSAYTCYFFSNGLSMSGIVSLLFCGITLKHYAYHTMSRRTQRASKYIFSTLAQLSENFIFIYLGMSLFTSAPVSEPVFSYVKPVFIVITLIAVVFTRYVAVFPLSEAINFFHRHARGQRHEEIPHSYQMMLFWAGLRGAVGVALAAGFKGSNAQMMRTTVLIVVVLTVVLFGGTTSRMLEVLGIRTGVEDDTGLSSDDEETLPTPTRSAWTSGNSGRGSGRWHRFYEDESTTTFGNPPRNAAAAAAAAARVGIHYAQPRLYNHHHQNPLLPPLQLHNQNVPNPLFSAASSDSYDSDVVDVLPLAPTSLENNNTSSSSHANNQGNPNTQNPAIPASGPLARLGDDGKWFQTIDERYLLPIFSNATASRTFHARRARRSAGPSSSAGSAVHTPADSEDEMDLSGQDVDLGSPPGGGSHRPTRSISVDESRIERGLPSPVMRSHNGGSPEGGRYS